MLIVVYSASIVSMLVLGLKRQSQKRKLRNLSKAIAELKQLAIAIKFNESESEVSTYVEKVAALMEDLNQLDIPFPTNTDGQILKVWITYLDMLLPLALSGDIYEARLTLARIEENYQDNFWSSLRR